MSLIVRKAHAGDSQVIADYNTRLARESEAKCLESNTIMAGVRTVLSRPEYGQYFLAEREDEIVGQVLITHEWSDWRNGLFWWFQSVYVPVEYRRSGVFSELYRHITELAKESSNVCGVRLYVEGENTPAQRTYRALGMNHTNYQVMEVEY